MTKMLDNIAILIQAHPFITFFLSMCSIHIIEIAPIKLSPLTWLKSRVVKIVKEISSIANEEYHNKIEQQLTDMRNEMDTISSDFRAYKVKQEEKNTRDMIKEAETLRRIILDFTDVVSEQMANGKVHKSKRSFENILFSVFPSYEEILKKLGISNGLVDSSIEYLTEVYEELRRTDGFVRAYGDEDDDRIRALFRFEIKTDEVK